MFIELCLLMAFPTTILFDQINQSCSLLFAFSQNINFCTHKFVNMSRHLTNHRGYVHAYFPMLERLTIAFIVV
jgi:hypothetical protein